MRISQTTLAKNLTKLRFHTSIKLRMFNTETLSLNPVLLIMKGLEDIKNRLNIFFERFNNLILFIHKQNNNANLHKPFTKFKMDFQRERNVTFPRVSYK